MKLFIIASLSLVALAAVKQVGWASNAPETFTTYAGYQFTYVQHPKFGRALRDPEGKIWSLNQGQFRNKGTSRNAELTDSEAMRHCASLGARLPRVGDLWSLRSYFEVKTWENGGPYVHRWRRNHDLYEELTDRSALQFMELFHLSAPHAAVWSRSRAQPADTVSDDVSYALELLELGWDEDRPTGALAGFDGSNPLSLICVD